jgi:raffinose/stachyose/melibiose transport system substrate-binding protein
MQRSKLFTLLLTLAVSLVLSVQVFAQDVTLRVLVHQNPPMIEFMEQFNAEFEAANPGITVDMAVVAPGDLATVTQTRLAAGDVDIIDIFGFDLAAQPYMIDVNAPAWQQLIEAGLLLDLTDYEFVNNYDAATLSQAGSYNDRVYAINLGRVIYSGIFTNDDLFAEFAVETPTTWEELVAACETFTENGISCMTAGGADGWPIFVGAYGLQGALFPDQEGYVEGLWTGEITFNDEANLVMWERFQVYASQMIERGASGLAADAAPGRFASGVVAMLPAGSWNASILEAAEPEFEWSYIPFPGSSNPEDNTNWFGKYDQGWAVAADSPNVDAAVAYLEAFSDPENYNAFANAVGFIPTQPTAALETQLGAEVAPYLENFRVGFEQYWIAPTGAGQWAIPWASHFAPFNEWEDAAALADRAQSDLQSGLDAVSGN